MDSLDLIHKVTPTIPDPWFWSMIEKNHSLIQDPVIQNSLVSRTPNSPFMVMPLSFAIDEVYGGESFPILAGFSDKNPCLSSWIKSAKNFDAVLPGLKWFNQPSTVVNTAQANALYLIFKHAAGSPDEPGVSFWAGLFLGIKWSKQPVTVEPDLVVDLQNYVGALTQPIISGALHALHGIDDHPHHRHPALWVSALDFLAVPEFATLASTQYFLLWALADDLPLYRPDAIKKIPEIVALVASM